MPEGLFTQCLTLLLKEPVTLDQLSPVVEDFGLVGRRDETLSWAMGGPSLVLSFRPEVKGVVVVDVVDRPWPDDMGEVEGKSGAELEMQQAIAAAWSLGAFGRFAYPGGLDRAADQPWLWREGGEAARGHRAFLRLRTSYMLGGDGGGEATIPEEYDAALELQYLCFVAITLMKLPQAAAFFNPSGEVLGDRRAVERVLEFSQEKQTPPWELWANGRVFRVDDGWALVDTVGHAQLDLPDLEAACPTGRFTPAQVMGFVRDMGSAMLRTGGIPATGEVMEGPEGVRWRAWLCPEGICAPPRPLIRLIPEGMGEVPAVLTEKFSAGE